MFEWDTRLFADEGVIYEREEERLSSQPDNIRLMSLFTWRLLKWLGPYGRFEGEVGIVPEYKRVPANLNEHYFVEIGDDFTITSIDSFGTSRLTQSAFSPLLVEAGIGANMRGLNTRFFESRFLLGIGFTQESRFNETEVDIPDSVVLADTSTGEGRAFKQIDTLNKWHNNVRLVGTTTTRPEYGPEATIYTTVRFGRFATNESELKIKAPVIRMQSSGFRPDVLWRNTLSWNIIKSVTLDYQVQYLLRWPKEVNLQTDMWLHRILIRVSFTSD
jgi:hypothetical protein